MSYLTLSLLGPPHIERDGAPIEFNRREALALLAYLAVTGPSCRQTLDELLWPEQDQASAYAAMGATLEALDSLGHGWVRSDQETIGLNRTSLWIDVDHLRRLLAECQTHGHAADQVCLACLALLTEAAQLYHGDFMAGFALPDCVAFNDWQLVQANRLRREAAQTFEKLVQGYSAQAEFEQAIVHARHWLTLEPFCEPAHRQLMRLYAWSGQQTAALDQYRACAQLLEASGGHPQEATVQLYQGIQDNHPPLPPSLSGRGSSLAHNLPVQPMPFFGREQELAEIARRLRDPACRLLTLSGPGGIGKTRLAIQAASENASVFQHGVCHVPLAGLSSVDLLAPTLIGALNLAPQGNADARAHLVRHLGKRRMLLVLDHLEHLVAGADLLTDLLSAAPGVKVICTSRESLNLQWEWLLPIQGLDFPQDDNLAAFEDYSAVQLFLQSAQRAAPGFSLPENDRLYVARICRFLEGMPLGIELAATWTHSLSCPEIAERIERSLDFLSTSLRDVPERQRSLRNVFDQSWNLLSEIERLVFGKLSVFRGGFRRDAAEKVTRTTLPLLSTLMHKSLLRRSTAGRYETLEILRQYAEEKLHQTPDEENETRDLHCAYYAEFLGRHKAQPDTPEITGEIENVRVAWQWAVARGKVNEIGQLMEGLYFFYNGRSWHQEGEEAFGIAADRLREICSASERASEETGRILGQVLARQGWFCEHRSHFDQAQTLLRESLAILRRLGARSETAFSLYALSGIAWRLGDCGDAEHWLEESLAIYTENGDRRGIARCLNSLGIVAAQSGKFARARQRHQESLDLYREIGDQQGAAASLSNLGVAAEGMGDYVEAQRLYQEAITAYKEAGDRRSTADGLNNLGFVLCVLGRDRAAGQCLQEALDTALEMSSVSSALEALVGLAILLTTEGKREQALELFTRILEHPAVYEEIQDGAEQILSELQSQLYSHALRHPDILEELGERIRAISKQASSPAKTRTKDAA